MCVDEDLMERVMTQRIKERKENNQHNGSDYNHLLRGVVRRIMVIALPSNAHDVHGITQKG